MNLQITMFQSQLPRIAGCSGTGEVDVNNLFGGVSIPYTGASVGGSATEEQEIK